MEEAPETRRNGVRRITLTPSSPITTAGIMCGDYAPAESRLNGALELFQTLKTRWRAGLTLAEPGKLAAEQSNFDEARNALAQALALFDEMDARPDAERMRAMMENLE